MCLHAAPTQSCAVIHSMNDDEALIAPPDRCPKCGNIFLECDSFLLGREWELSCFMCGHLWWCRRVDTQVLFEKYRYVENDNGRAG